MKHHVAICSKWNNFEVPEVRNNAEQTQMEQPETLRESTSSTVAPATTPVTTATAPSDVKPDERGSYSLQKHWNSHRASDCTCSCCGYQFWVEKVTYQNIWV